MERINIRLDKHNNIQTTISGLAYLIEHGYLFDKAIIIREDIEGYQTRFTYYDNDNVAGVINDDTDELMSIDEDTLYARFIINKGDHNLQEEKETVNDYDLSDSDFSDLIGKNFLDSLGLLDDEGYEYSFIYEKEDGSFEKTDNLDEFLAELFELEEDELLIVDEEIDMSKEYTKKDIERMVEEETNSTKTYSLEEIIESMSEIL